MATSKVYKAQEGCGILSGQLRTSCEASLFYLQFSSTNMIMQLESDPVSCGKKSYSEHHNLFLACVKGLGMRLIAQRERKDGGLVREEREKAGRKKTERGNNKAERRMEGGGIHLLHTYCSHHRPTYMQSCLSNHSSLSLCAVPLVKIFLCG